MYKKLKIKGDDKKFLYIQMKKSLSNDASQTVHGHHKCRLVQRNIPDFVYVSITNKSAIAEIHERVITISK